MPQMNDKTPKAKNLNICLYHSPVRYPGQHLIHISAHPCITLYVIIQQLHKGHHENYDTLDDRYFVDNTYLSTQTPLLDVLPISLYQAMHHV